MGGNSIISLNYTVVTPPPKTSLSTTPPPEPLPPNITFGRTINAVTGQTCRNVVDTNKSSAKTVETGQVSEAFRFKQFSSASEVERSIALNFQTSIMLPPDALDVSIKRGFDFSSSKTTQAFSSFYLIQWEKNGPSKALPENPTLYRDAQKLLDDNDFANFRASYGDYYVHQILTRARFTTLWRCTGTTETSMRNFKTDLNVALNAPGNVSDVARFETALKNSASKNNVTLDVQFDTHGSADDVTYNQSDVSATMTDFCSNVTPVNDQVLYRHHSMLKAGYPTEIDMDPTLYMRIMEIPATTSFLILLNGVTPGTAANRSQRRKLIVKIYNYIIERRKELEETGTTSWGKVQTVIEAIEKIRYRLLALLERQEIVLKVTNIKVEDIVSLFSVDHKDESGNWINAVYGRSSFQFGETALDSSLYGISTETIRIEKPGVYLQQIVDALNFPSPGIKGIAVGVTVVPNWSDGTDGFWCISKANPLGTTAFKINIKSEGSRGMDWTLCVDYIPNSEYADMQFDNFEAMVRS
ncbi:hypothetical protein BU17DRAFT_80787 [Hysterangium stoloniferum]|nr:hypothetical protein BU17DRAFT_80787 [Hysterangium stoloniferum]